VNEGSRDVIDPGAKPGRAGDPRRPPARAHVDPAGAAGREEDA
jgi:hypothetical protein